MKLVIISNVRYYSISSSSSYYLTLHWQKFRFGSNSGRTNQIMLKFGQEIDDRYLVFFGSDNLDKATFGSKSGPIIEM